MMASTISFLMMASTISLGDGGCVRVGLTDDTTLIDDAVDHPLIERNLISHLNPLSFEIGLGVALTLEALRDRCLILATLFELAP